MNDNSTCATQAQQHCKSNFLQTIIILFAMSVCLGTSFKTQAQQVHFDVNNMNLTPGCDWTVTIYDVLNNVLIPPFTVPAGTRLTGPAGCKSWLGPPMDHVTVSNGLCVLSFPSSGGLIPHISYNPPCSATTCSPTVDGSGALSGSGCAQNGFMIIRIW